MEWEGVSSEASFHWSRVGLFSPLSLFLLGARERESISQCFLFQFWGTQLSCTFWDAACPIPGIPCIDRLVTKLFSGPLTMLLRRRLSSDQSDQFISSPRIASASGQERKTEDVFWESVKSFCWREFQLSRAGRCNSGKSASNRVARHIRAFRKSDLVSAIITWAEPERGNGKNKLRLIAPDEHSRWPTMMAGKPNWP